MNVLTTQNKSTLKATFQQKVLVKSYICAGLFFPPWLHTALGNRLIRSAMPPLCSHSSFPPSFCPAAFGTATLTKAGKSSLWMINARSLCHLEPLQNTALKFTKAQNAGVNYSSAWLVLLKARTGADKVARAAPRVGTVGCSWQNSGRRPLFWRAVTLQFVICRTIRGKRRPVVIKCSLFPQPSVGLEVSGWKGTAGFCSSQNEAGKQSCAVRPTRNEMRRRTGSSLLETSCTQQECISKTTLLSRQMWQSTEFLMHLQGNTNV